MKQRARSALAVLDGAIELTRSEPLSRNLLCAAPALLLTWLALFATYLEQVEGVHSLRPVWALGLSLGWCARAAVLTRYAGQCSARLLSTLDVGARHSRLDTRLRAALGLGLELLFWLFLFGVSARVDPWLCLLLAPLLALRGAVAPGWLATADSAEAGAAPSATLYVLGQARGQRLVGVVLELLFLLSALALFLNLGALAVAAISLSQDLLGLRLAFVRAFISPRNPFALIALVGVSLSAFEPLRAAAAAVLFTQQRRAREALEVRALVEAAVAPRTAKVLAAAVALALSLPASTYAQGDDWQRPAPPPGLGMDCDHACAEARARDDQVLVTLVSILDAPDFRDFPEGGWSVATPEQPSFGSWLERMTRWLVGRPDEPERRGSDLSEIKPIHVPLAVLLTGLLALVLMLGGIGLLHAQRTRLPKRPSSASVDATPPAATSAVQRDDGSLHARLRGVYLAALSSLAQRRLLTLSAAATNGDYLRTLRGASTARAFVQLTELFERAHYGEQPLDSVDLARAEALAQQLAASSEGP